MGVHVHGRMTCEERNSGGALRRTKLHAEVRERRLIVVGLRWNIRTRRPEPERREARCGEQLSHSRAP
jgi:hypothetical protein